MNESNLLIDYFRDVRRHMAVGSDGKAIKAEITIVQAIDENFMKFLEIQKRVSLICVP